jgi:predicted transposase YdaD
MTSIYDVLITEGKQKGKAEGKIEGKIETQIAVIENLLQEFPMLSDEKIANLAEAEVSLVNSIRNDMNRKN